MNLNLIDDVKEIIMKNTEEINKTGKGFNLISILGMETNERYTHSNIIAELLNSKSSHTFGNRFFKLFLDELNITDFSCSNYDVITEEYMGSIKCNDGTFLRTFIDIVIRDKNTGKVILIENKIWADDQPFQIERYYEAYKGNISKLYYLNVNEWNDCPTTEPEIIKVFENISYKKHIKNWLTNCIVASSQKPYINKQIEVYYETILKLSNQNIYKKMNEEIENKITESFDNFETANEIANTYYHIKNVIINDFRKELYSQIQNREIKINDEAALECIFDDDNWNEKLYLGFKFKGSWSEELKLDVRNHLQKICEKFDYASNDNWFFWVNTNNSTLMNSNFKNLSNAEIIDLKDKKTEIIEDVKNHFESILKQLYLEFN